MIKLHFYNIYLTHNRSHRGSENILNQENRSNSLNIALIGLSIGAFNRSPKINISPLELIQVRVF